MNKHSQHKLGHTLFLIGSFAFLIGITILHPIASNQSGAFGASEIIQLSNQTRNRLDRPELKSNYLLTNAAQMKAEDMAKMRYFAHTAYDGTVAWDYINEVGYSYETAGENLAITNENAEAVINGWLNSPTHRDNLLNTNYTDFGSGTAYYGDYQGHQNTTVVVAFYAHSAARQDVAAATSPAGTSTMFKIDFDVPTSLVASIAVALMVAGIFIEIRHISKLHHQNN